MYTNVPTTAQDENSTVAVFDAYYTAPLQLNSAELSMAIAFFEGRGFQPVAAESTAITLLRQAKIDGYSATQVLDNLQTLSATEINALLAEILNYNRLNTSLVGTVQRRYSPDVVARNLVA